MKVLICTTLAWISILYGRIDCEYMSHLQQRVIQEICSKYDCSCCGTGGAAFYDVDRIFLSFQFDRIYSEVEFRIMAVDVANLFIGIINKDKIIRPYLRRYPATISTIRLGFFFPDQKGEICMGGIAGGRLDSYKDSGEEFKYIDGINETYEEALYKIREFSE